MGDSDSTGRRRPKFIEGDIERSSRMRRAPSSPIVSPSIEDDVTPLPQEPPDISQIDGFATMPPPIQRALLTLHNTSREHDVTFAKLWGARHVADDVADIRQRLEHMKPYLDYLENVHGVLDQHGKQLFRVVQWIEGRRDVDRKLEATLESLDKRLDTIEADFRTMNTTITTLGRDIAEGWRRRDKEFEDFKGEVDERFEKLIAEQKADKEKSEARIRSLEDSRTSQNGKLAGISLVIVAIAWLIEHFLIK